MDKKQLQEIIKQNPDLNVQIVGVPYGEGKINYVISIPPNVAGLFALDLRTYRGKVRSFQTIASAVKLLTEMGLYKFEIRHDRCVKRPYGTAGKVL